ncbi:hypothetical protein ACJMK2_025719 [Sinanodonta woodiana]|uniref:Uncharacterized protein n=1 Tax=Sinanodonta woodiana TaxID=1069815 RepID=A0ABD3XJ90_SINWO
MVFRSKRLITLTKYIKQQSQLIDKGNIADVEPDKVASVTMASEPLHDVKRPTGEDTNLNFPMESENIVLFILGRPLMIFSRLHLLLPDCTPVRSQTYLDSPKALRNLSLLHTTKVKGT